MLELRIVGPQFGEPSILMRWLAQRYDVPLQVRQLSEFDAALELTARTSTRSRVSAGVPFHVLASRPAIWDRQLVYDTLFRGADVVGIVFTRLEQIAHLNQQELDKLSPWIQSLRTPPIMAANDAHCRRPDFSTLPASEVGAQLGVSVREITIGPFSGAFAAVEGAEAFWSDMLIAAGEPPCWSAFECRRVSNPRTARQPHFLRSSSVLVAG